MASVTVHLSDDLIQAARMDRTNLSQEASRLIALELFREHEVSLGRAAELCQTPISVFLEFVASHGVSPSSYAAEDPSDDLQTLARLRQ